MNGEGLLSSRASRIAGMSDVIVIVFDGQQQASDALASLRQLEREDAVHFEDTAVVTKDQSGKLHVKNEVAGRTETGAVAGAIVGGMLTLMFPGVGLIVGALSGAGIGALMGEGVDKGFVKEVSEALQPGTSALFLVTKQVNPAVFDAMKPFTGRIYHTSLSEDAEDRLTRALA